MKKLIYAILAITVVASVFTTACQFKSESKTDVIKDQSAGYALLDQGQFDPAGVIILTPTEILLFREETNLSNFVVTLKLPDEKVQTITFSMAENPGSGILSNRDDVQFETIDNIVPIYESLTAIIATPQELQVSMLGGKVIGLKTQTSTIWNTRKVVAKL